MPSMPNSTRESETARPQLPSRTAGPLSARMAAGGAFPTERRNIVARQHLVHRIIEEYEEMPGLHLAAAQAQRLFGLRGRLQPGASGTRGCGYPARREGNGSYARHGVWP